MNGQPLASATHLLSLEDLSTRQWDVLVAGAGPAGAVVAQQCARRGLRVLVAEKARFPRPKVCGCCLNGAALAALDAAGLSDLPVSLGATPVDRWQLCAPGGHANCALPAGVALSREAFDNALAEAAAAAGATVLQETTARLLPLEEEESGTPVRSVELSQAGQRITISAAVVVAADGLSGRLLEREPGFDWQVEPRSRLGAGVVLEDAPPAYNDGVIYMACGNAGYVGLVRLEDGRLDVAAALDRDAIRTAGNPAGAAAQVLAQAGLPPIETPPGAWRGTPSLTRRRAQIAGNRVFVVGDAAGYIEPFTGEGMAWALQAAVAVSPLVEQAVADWRTEFAQQWATTHRGIVKRRQRVCWTLSQVLKRPRLASTAAFFLARAPWLATPVIRAVNASST